MSMETDWFVTAIILTILSGIVGLVLIVANILSIRETLKRKVFIDRPRGKVVISLNYVLIGALLIAPPFILEFVKRESTIISPTKNIVADFPGHTILWQWDWNRLITGNRLADYSIRSAEVIITAHPITENPKVRSLRYTIDADTRKDPSSLLRFEKAGNFQSKKYLGEDVNFTYQQQVLHRKVKSLLYEFNEANSKELAKLYNPLDNSQQERFRKLVSGFFDSQLDEMGAHITLARFEIVD